MSSTREKLESEIKNLPLIKEIKELFPQESKEVDELISSLVRGFINPNLSEKITSNPSERDIKK
jgi:cell fate (sporulation/competence/biofilm development) regulator YmcA (YheA/YmcA/DUF963 family)